MLEERSEEVEIMDDLNIAGEVVNQTLRELNTINKRLGGNQISVSAFKHFASGEETLTIADLGCGGGDIMMEMADWCKRNSINSNFIGIDANQNIVNYAIENTRKYPSISYRAINIFSEEFKKQSFDIIHCCLFIHHFTSDQLVELFKGLRNQARLGVIINDLHRHPLAYKSISLLTTLFSKSVMVRNDAAVSVARGFKRKELESILESAGITNYKLSWKWAFRWKLIF